MTWTLVDDDNDTIQVRATLSMQTDQEELKKLIIALEKRLQLGRDKDEQRFPDRAP